MKKSIALIVVLIFALMMMAIGCAKTAEPAVDAPVEETETAEAPEASEEAPAEGGQGYVIGFSNCYIGNTWRNQYVEEVENLLLDYKDQGVVSDYIISNSNNDITEQINQINSMINSGVDAIVMDPISSTGMEDVIETAQENGIIVVICNQDAAYKGCYAITEKWSDTMTMAATWMSMKLQGKGDIVYISGVAGNPNDTCRTVEVESVLSNYPEIKMLASEPGEWSQSKAQTVMSTFLNTYGDSIDAVICQDVMSEGILQAYANAGITPSIVAGDSSRSFFKTWAADYPELQTICCPCVTNPGQWGVQLAIGLLDGKTINDSVLESSSMNPDMKCLIQVDPPYIVLPQEDIDNMTEFTDWMAENYPNTVIYSREQALELTEGLDDGYTMGFPMSDDVLATIFA